MHRSRKAAWVQAHRGFESLPVRHEKTPFTGVFFMVNGGEDQKPQGSMKRKGYLYANHPNRSPF